MSPPSPDWLTGVPSVLLKLDGPWIDAETITIHARDCGMNPAATYRAAKITVEPFVPLAVSSAPIFVKNGAPVPVGTVTIRRVRR